VNPTYTWFVTQNPNFIEIVTGLPRLNYLPVDGAEPGLGSLLFQNIVAPNEYAAPPYPAATASTLNNIEITWKSFAYNPAEPVFVVVQVIGDNGICYPNNLKVYKIEPIHAFTLDIDNLLANGENHTPTVFGDSLGVCISEIQSATYDPTAPEGVLYDYGLDTMYFEVVAANWYDKWELGVQIDGVAIDSTQTARIDWAYAGIREVPLQANYMDTISTWSLISDFTVTANNVEYKSLKYVAPQNGTNAVSDDGESIIIRVILDHNNGYEGVRNLPITLSVNGVLALEDLPTNPGTYVPGDPLVVGDIHHEAGANLPAEECPWFDGYVNDQSLQVLVKRPWIISNTVNGNPPPANSPFLPKK
jgi:hypothetical protein